LIEHPFFQRLRRINQLGLTHLVYPGALHTRFHHVLGAMHLMSMAVATIRRKGNEITEWLIYFAETVLDAQAHSQELVEFLIAKTKFYDRLRGQFNERQDKVIARIMREGPCGFKGGLSAENYIALTGTSRATATRDLQDLVEKQALIRTGTLKSTRYHLEMTRTL
jgi:Fic family protein